MTGELDPRIAALEQAAAQHWRAADTAWLGSWLLRANGGFTGRANSALPLADPGTPLDRAVDAVEEWYVSRGLPPMIVIPGPVTPGDDRHPLDSVLAARGWAIRSGAAIVMTAATADVAASAAHPPAVPASSARPRAEGECAHTGSPWAVTLAERPDREWLGRYHYRGKDLPPEALSLLLSAAWQAFASVKADGRTVAVGRVSVAENWAGLTAVDVDPRCRRMGMGTAIAGAAAAEAARHGAGRIFLQVEEHNTAARALYARCGFHDTHRYHYRVAPRRETARSAP